MIITVGKSYKVRGQWYRVEKIENGKVFANIGGYVLPYDADQFQRMVMLPSSSFAITNSRSIIICSSVIVCGFRPIARLRCCLMPET